MDDKAYLRKAFRYLETLCGVKPNRRTGSAGNREAVRYFAETIKGFGYEVETTPFPCLDYARGDAKLESEMREYQIFTSPYSLGCDVAGKIVPVSTPQELESCSCQGEILLMYGSLCDEQLMPKNFVFYNPEHHHRIIALLEEKKPAAIIT
ncbi:MAG: Zn-dependent exopeptidase M28, partial [Candidatus Promineifilaceae bacterium]